MQSCMNDHFIPLCESFLAILTRIWPGVGVNALVFLEQISPLEVLWTEGALIRPFLCMHTSAMQLQFRSAGESSSALLTHEGFFASVGSTMFFHVALLRKGFTAKVTAVRFVAAVNP